MTVLTKLLPAGAAPAQPLLERAKSIVLTSAERAAWPESVTVDGEVVSFGDVERRELEVGDVFLDEAGGFWVVRPGVETVLHVSGDLDVMREAVGALINRGIPVAEAPEGFAVLPQANIVKMLGMIGLEVTEVQEPFEPIRFARGGCCGGGGGGCGCGGHGHGHGHHHHHEGGCGCGGHDHEESCGCGGHHHDDDCGCGCGGHGHHHHEGGCGCGGHDHEESCGCGCGCSDEKPEEKKGGCGCGCH